MILKRLFYLLLISGTFFYSGCYYDVEEVLYPSGECNTDSVTYSLVVLPILEQQCYGCHTGSSLSGNVNLEGYNNLKTLVNSGKFLGAIKHEVGYTPMPDGAPQLPQCDIAMIEAWIAEGAPDN